MTVIRFEPLDTLFFRDGRPYNQGESNQAGLESLFPPPPPTLVGAIRAACARALGWESDDWDKEICERLGNGEDLGRLCFRGPVLMQNDKALFPAPAYLMGVSEANEEAYPSSLALLVPGTETRCDLGKGVLLPAARDAPEGAKLLGEKGWWITAQGLETVLRGDLPEPACLIHQRKLWKTESRVGIARDETKRTTAEGALYSPSHIRLAKGVALALEAHELPPECIKALPDRPQPVGGESRTCWLSHREDVLTLPGLPDLRADGDVLRYVVTILTPADTGAPPRPGKQDYAGLPGRIISACLPRPIMIGGWDSQARKPLTLRPYLTPGSVLFLEAAPKDIEAIKKLHGTAIGARTEWGFGVIAVGLWPN